LAYYVALLRSERNEHLVEEMEQHEALRLGEERLRQAVRVAGIGIYDHDQRSDVIYWSPRMREIFGWPADEPVTLERTLACVHPDDRARVDAAATRAHAPDGDGAFDVEYRIVRPDGEVRWIRTRGQTFFGDEPRRAIRSVGAITDVTDQHLAEEKEAALHGQLAHAQRLESMGRLASAVAHDFDGMLRVILGFVSLIRLELAERGKAIRYLEEIERVAGRARDVTWQLLTFSRKQIASPSAVNLNDQIGGATKSLLRLVGEDVELRVMRGEKLWTVSIDPSQVDQILVNLAINAREAMPGGGKLTLETTNVSFSEEYCSRHPGVTPGEYVLLAVSGSGVGMGEETRSHAFEPLCTTAETGKGRGLGLATVHRIVEQNQGFVNVYTGPHHGTRVKVYLPRGLADLLEEVERALPSGEAVAGTVLLVEDDESLRRLSASLLDALGHTVVVASSPTEAISLFEESDREIDLVLTDAVMPGMSGRELADRLQASRPGLKVLFASGDTANVIAHHGILQEGVHVLAKPFGMTELSEKLQEILASK
jgi:two-component system cell cycle sensor histidine kinase/response regulator CckA